LKVALGQIDIKFEDKIYNQDKCINMVNEASKNNADIILFPEMTLTGFSFNYEITNENYENSQTINFFRELALKNKIYIGFGVIINKYNKFIIVDKYGNIIIDYNKIHTFSFGNETKFYNSGNDILFCNIDNVCISAFICYDLRFPEIFQYACEKSNIIFLIANWPKNRINHWKILLQARAIENQCFIVGVNCIGTQNDIVYNGNSIVVNPYGDIIQECGSYETVKIADIDADIVCKCRDGFNVKCDRKKYLYKNLYL